MNYHFGVPGFIVWIQHILLGIVLFYIGYNGLSSGKVTKNMCLLLIITGVLAILYHGHIWLNHLTSKKSH